MYKTCAEKLVRDVDINYLILLERKEILKEKFENNLNKVRKWY